MLRKIYHLLLKAMGAQQSRAQERIKKLHREIEARAVNTPPSSQEYAEFQKWEKEKLQEIAEIKAKLRETGF